MSRQSVARLRAIRLAPWEYSLPADRAGIVGLTGVEPVQSLRLGVVA